jgi:membrane protease YdiL (CAAX protease family)
MMAETGKPARASSVLGLALAFGWPLALLIPGLSTHQVTNVHDDLVGAVIKWLVVLALCAIAFGIQRRKPGELGVRPLGWRDALAAMGAFVLALILSGAASRFVTMPSSVSDLNKLAAVPLGVRVVVVLTAAICEEFMYRGFGIEQLASLLGNRWLGGLLSLVLFTVSHAGLYGWSAALVIPGIVGAVVTGLYLWRRNLPACMLMHAIIDGMFLLLMPALIHTK